MNMKTSFANSPAYLTKVKKEKSLKNTPRVFSSDAVIEQRHEKINFKQYLQNIKEEHNADDEFYDIQEMQSSSLKGDGRIIDFGGSEDDHLHITEDAFIGISELKKDDSITIRDQYDSCWHVTRALTGQIVFESQEYEISGKFNFNEFIAKMS